MLFDSGSFGCNIGFLLDRIGVLFCYELLLIIDFFLHFLFCLSCYCVTLCIFVQYSVVFTRAIEIVGILTPAIETLGILTRAKDIIGILTRAIEMIGILTRAIDIIGIFTLNRTFWNPGTAFVSDIPQIGWDIYIIIMESLHVQQILLESLHVQQK